MGSRCDIQVLQQQKAAVGGGDRTKKLINKDKETDKTCGAGGASISVKN